jgi:16S rRNA (uracil1498-N3)-methyltransferase
VRLTRVHCAVPLAQGGEATLPDAAATHVTRVLRLRVGDRLAVFDGRGSEHHAEIGAITGGEVRVRVLERVASRPESPLAVTLVQGVSRGERMDWALQKATELGVSAIAPVLCTRSVVRLDAGQAGAKLRHWQAIVVAACEQSGRSRLPELRMPESLHAYLERLAGHACRVILDPQATAELAGMPDPGAAVDLLIGPEGGFDDEELALAGAAGFQPVRLGPRVLRTETAGTVALAVLQSRWGDLAAPRAT